MLYNQRKSCIKIHYFSAAVKRNFKLKAIYLYHLFLISQYQNFEQRRGLLRECIETYLQ